jgi:predicted membrane channel-forming protein YqfA (hemolysin III family)
MMSSLKVFGRRPEAPWRAGVVGAYCVGIWAFLNGRLRYRSAVWHAMVVVAMAIGFGALACGLER